MQTVVEREHGFSMELGTRPDPGGVPLLREPIEADLVDLVDEAFVGAVLAGRVPPRPEELRVSLVPRWRREPFVEAVEVRLRADGDRPHTRTFRVGGWSRRAPALAAGLRQEGAVGAEESVYCALLAERRRAEDDAFERGCARLLPPLIESSALADLGVRSLAGEGAEGADPAPGEPGGLDPERPVLVNARMLAEIVAHTEEAGLAETGGGVLGKVVRLAEPLPGTLTPFVTLLTTHVRDARHVGGPGRFQFSPEALADAAATAALRGRGEVVLTAWHSHGWGAGCGDCNQKTTCALPTSELLSDDDYRVLESLFPGKSTVMPVAGRRAGARGRRPVLTLHAWRGGEMRPLRWTTYED